MATPTRVKRTPARSTTACTECQRRKQKATHVCKFAPKRTVGATNSEVSNTSAAGKVQSPARCIEQGPLPGFGTINTQHDDLRTLGYLADAQKRQDNESTEPAVISLEPSGSMSNAMENALRAIPPKPYADILVHHFLNHTNYQYYALYPPAFMQDYAAWWSAKASGLPLTSAFTCLLLRVCACAVPYVDDAICQKLELVLGTSVEQLSMNYHNVARQLSYTIGPGKGGLMQVQQLFLTAQWLKTEALFVESWHALGTAIHEAQELGMHRSSSCPRFTDFDREMRRRLWCILYAWDWQMSLLLSRPFIINSNCCVFEWPDLGLETDDIRPESPSPIIHMVLQCQLGLSISRLPGAMSGVLSPTQAMTVQQELDKWFASFPAAYSISKPDTRWDDTHHFVRLQRFQLHTIGYMVMLMPLKQTLTKHINAESPSIEKSLQTTAVEIALKLLKSCDDLLRHILPLNAKFHFAPFLMFDTAALLCSAVMHDRDGTLPQRGRLVEVISETLVELGKLSDRAKTGMICYMALKKLVACLPLGSIGIASAYSMTPQSSTDLFQTLPDVPSIESLPYATSTLSAKDIYDQGLDPTSLDFLSSDPTNGHTALENLSHVELGELGDIWDWGNLEIELSNGAYR
ncbi:fungal-specific transcription factor domain-containing protein [Aspergillus desertorum]